MTTPQATFGTSLGLASDLLVVGAPDEPSCSTGVNGNQMDTSCYTMGAMGAGAAYVFTRSSGVWSQQAYLKASNTSAGVRFGTGVAVSGNTVVVGSLYESSCGVGVNGDQTQNMLCNDTGAAYVFTASGSTWSQQAYLKPSDTTAGELFGQSVAVAGDTIVVGAPDRYDLSGLTGAGYTFTRSGTTWTEDASPLTSSNGGNLGTSVALWKSVVVLGAYADNSCSVGVNSQPSGNCAFNGAALAYTRTGSSWTPLAYLKPSSTAAAGAEFGQSVAVSGENILVGGDSEASCSNGVDGDETNSSCTGAGAGYLF
jgi:hypothetical protein